MNTTSLVPFFLGTFSGFLATLPIGPAKILAVRKFLLITKGNENEVSNFQSSNTILLASISGLIFAQILFFLALQFPFLYSLWVKPHFFSFFFVSILFIYLYKIKNLQFNIYNTKPFLKSEQNFSYQQAAFLETLLFQLLNPVVLPNPVFCRLTNVFLFRYSTIFSFFAGNLLGLLSGYGLFYLSTLFLVKKLEEDAPTIYRLVKIKIHQFFGTILVIFSFICLSRTPLPTIKPFQLKAIPPRFSFNTAWYENIWPDSFFGYDRWKRPLRLIACDNKKSQPNDEIKPFNKMFFSQFFFEGCVKDGKYQLYHNFPQSLSIVSKNIHFIIQNFPFKTISFEDNENKKLLENWIKEKKTRQNQINKNINNKINQIEKGSVFEELVEKKFSSLDNNKNKISKQMDPRLSPYIRGTNSFLKNKSFLFLTKEYFSKKDSLVPIEKKNLTNHYTKNKLKLFLAKNSHQFSEVKQEEKPFITWQPVGQDSSEINLNLKEKNLQNSNLAEKESDFKDFNKKITWDEQFKQFSKSLSSGSQIGKILFQEDSIDKLQQEENMEWNEENTAKLAKIYKPMPLWNPNFNKKELDLIKRQSTNKLHLKIFFPKSNHLADRQNFVPPLMPFYRRNEFPGTITSRRGKAVCWNTFQKKPHSPLFVNHLTLLKNFFAKRKKIQINQEVPARSWQPTSRLFQFLRDYLLSLQAYIRKYVKLPLLIILKNLVRQLFFQPAEWEKDWTNLSKEMYIECDFYGKAVSMGVKLPNFLANDEPKQIKIINPFQLRFWTRSTTQNLSFQENENYSFLNVWGRETKMPFGKVKKSPSFWQLLVERIKLLLQYKILKNLSLSSSRNTLDTQSQLKGETIQSTSEVKEKSLLLSVKNEKEDLKNQKIKIEKNKLEKLNNSINKNNLKNKTKKINLIKESTQVKPFSRLSPTGSWEGQKKEKVTSLRRYTFKNSLILLQKQWFNIYRIFLKKQKEFFFQLKKNIFQVKKWFLRKNTQTFKIFIKLCFNISKILSRFYYKIFEYLNYLLLKLTKNQKIHSSNLDLFAINSTNNLSQAYIIHSIWEDRMMNRPNLTSLMKLWNSNSPLKTNLQDFLNKQGILGNEKPDNLKENQWNDWLKNYRGFTPSLKLWAIWSPNYWTQAVEQYWKGLPSSKLESILNQDPNKIENNLYSDFENTNKTNLLESHLPLFQEAQKQKKLWKFNLLARNYTEVSNDGDVDSFFSWENKYFDKKTNYLFDTLKKVKGKEKDLLVSPTIVSSLPQLKETKSRKISPQQDIRKELPLIQREKKRFDFDIKLQTLRQRGTFFPVSIRRWKLKKLKNKLEKLAKTVIKKPQSGEFSSYLAIGEKNKKIIRELFQSENRLFANILENWNSKVLDDELLMYNTVSSILRFVNKNTNLSLVSYGIQRENNSDLISVFSRIPRTNYLDFYFALLEDIYLPNHLREIRILDCLNFENKNFQSTVNVDESTRNQQKPNFLPSGTQWAKNEKSIYTETINQWRLMVDQNQNLAAETNWAIKDRQKIIRFLWPTHRLEDLSCINRFWMGTANQSRFSMLRIQNSPNI
jgi:hypothetical protein